MDGSKPTLASENVLRQLRQTTKNSCHLFYFILFIYFFFFLKKNYFYGGDWVSMVKAGIGLALQRFDFYILLVTSMGCDGVLSCQQ